MEFRMTLVMWAIILFGISVGLTSCDCLKTRIKGYVDMPEGPSRKPLTDEQRLLRDLMTDYEPHTRPVFNASHPINVKLGVTLNQIFDLDERNQVLTSHIWLDQEWYDEKLLWQPEDYNGLQTLRVPCHLIWRPDIILYNSADDYTDGYMPALAMVSYDGHVFWPPIVRLRSTCRIDITYFPFDDQTCAMKLGSWAYDGLQLDVLKREKPIDLTNYVSNGEWDLINVKVVRNVEYYSCCPEPYPDVTFTLHIRRRTLYYTYSVIIPCIMLSSLTLLGFWIPPEGGEKVGLGLTILLAYSVFMLLIAENMPATSFYVPLIGVYIIVAMGLTCVNVAFAVFVSYIYHKGNMGHDVPSWLRTIVAQLDRVLGVNKRVLPHKGSERDRHAQQNSFPDVNSAPDMKTPLHNSYSSVNFTFKNECECTLDYENVHVTARENTQVRESARKTKRKVDRQGSSQRWEANGDIASKLDAILNKQDLLIRCRESHVNREWQDIAEVVDRALFWFYFVITLSTTVVILLLIPLGKTVKL